MFNLTASEKLTYLSKIEIDITQNCNLSCTSCVRGCDKFKSQRCMDLEAIGKFIEMSKNYPWVRVGLMGGEITTHPQLWEILNLMKEFKDQHPQCTIWTMTNGVISYAFPPWLEVVVNKDHSHHHAFYVSPTDEGYSMDKRTCHVLTDCGMGYSVYGFTPCCNSHTMIRCLPSVDGIQDLKNVTYENLMKLCNIYCKHCGWYMMDNFTSGKLLEYPTDYMSETWVRAYERYNMGIE